uniref:Synaptonemal complex central element protein 3 n=1 Tax=Leptobrachium leishanense TaxID=445787 RepID=A0A8C5R9T6_9ANUR
MLDPDSGIASCSEVSKVLQDMNKDLEKMLEEMEKISIQTTWMSYDMVVIRTKPELAESVRKLDETFLKCKEEVETKWQEMLNEFKGQT